MALVVATAGANLGCVALHIHDSANAPGGGDPKRVPRDLGSPDPERPEDPGERGIWARVALPAGGGFAPAADGEAGFFSFGGELSVMTFEHDSSHAKPRFFDVIEEQPLHGAVGYLAQFDGREERDAFGPGRVYAEIQYERYMDDFAFAPGYLLGVGPFFEHGSNTFGAHASICGWFIGVLWVRPCVRPAVRSDYGFEFSGSLSLQGYAEWFWSR